MTEKTPREPFRSGVDDYDFIRRRMTQLGIKPFVKEAPEPRPIGNVSEANPGDPGANAWLHRAITRDDYGY